VSVLLSAGVIAGYRWRLNFCCGRFFWERDAPWGFRFDHFRSGYPEIFFLDDPSHAERKNLGAFLLARAVAADHFEEEFFALGDATRYFKTATVVADVAGASVNVEWRASGICSGDFQSELKADAFAVTAVFDGFARKAGPVDLHAHETFPVLRRKSTTEYLVHAAGQILACDMVKLGGASNPAKTSRFKLEMLFRFEALREDRAFDKTPHVFE
jgi:hypothetical protein